MSASFVRHEAVGGVAGRCRVPVQGASARTVAATRSGGKRASAATGQTPGVQAVRALHNPLQAARARTSAATTAPASALRARALPPRRRAQVRDQRPRAKAPRSPRRATRPGLGSRRGRLAGQRRRPHRAEDGDSGRRACGTGGRARRRRFRPFSPSPSARWRSPAATSAWAASAESIPDGSQVGGGLPVVRLHQPSGAGVPEPAYPSGVSASGGATPTSPSSPPCPRRGQETPNRRGALRGPSRTTRPAPSQRASSARR